MAHAKPEGVQRFAALLLFQFRVVTNGESNKRRLCEKRLILFDAGDGRSAMREAKRGGRAAQHHYLNGFGGMVYFEFVGVLDLLQLGLECEPDEVWYSLCTLVEPMERRARVLPRQSELRAISGGAHPKRDTSKQLRRVNKNGDFGEARWRSIHAT
jgi:hypothetical protein